jgi:amino acid permease
MGLFNGDEMLGYAALAVLLLLIVIPLSMQAKMSLLSRSSFISIIAILYMIGVLVYLGGSNAANNAAALAATPLPSPRRMLGAAPVVIYSLGCQVQAVVRARSARHK